MKNRKRSSRREDKAAGRGTGGKDAVLSGQSRTGSSRVKGKPKADSQAKQVSGSRASAARGGSKSKSTAPVEKNGVYETEVTGLSHEGEGVGYVNGFTLFIRGALPGELVRLQVLKVKKQYGYARLVEVLRASPDRMEPPCAVFGRCGGCLLQHLSYEAQLGWKRQSVIDVLQRIGKLEVAEEEVARKAPNVTSSVEGDDQVGIAQREFGVVVHPTIGMTDPWRYRNKSQVPIGADREGGLIAGFYAQASHRIIDLDACVIQHEANDRVVMKVKELGRKLGIPLYREETHEGLLRHVVVKVGFFTGELMVVLVTNGERIPKLEQWIDGIRTSIPEVVSICQNVNTRQTNVIFGDRTNVLWGRDVIYDTIGDIRFAISARSFYQVNPVQTKVLYEKALEYAALSGEETVIDAYCGIGTISLFLAQRAKRVYGVEIVEEAIEDARRNAELNGVDNVEFAVGKAEEIIPAWREQGIAPDVIVVDPPRKGCDAALLETIIAMRPERVVYVSCNPSTLARDLRILEDGGFRTVEAQPVDMFPWTVHVECVIGICRVDT